MPVYISLLNERQIAKEIGVQYMNKVFSIYKIRISIQFDDIWKNLFYQLTTRLDTKT